MTPIIIAGFSEPLSGESGEVGLEADSTGEEREEDRELVAVGGNWMGEEVGEGEEKEEGGSGT